MISCLKIAKAVEHTESCSVQHSDHATCMHASARIRVSEEPAHPSDQDILRKFQVYDCIHYQLILAS